MSSSINYNKNGKPELTSSGKAKTILILLVILTIIWFAFLRDSKPDIKPVSEMGVDAYVVSQQFIKRKLKAPATADFPAGTTDRVEYLGDSVFYIKSYVDAQNSFGAQIRSNYTAKVKYLGDENWSPIDINLLENQ